jgi:hypothetical protein
MKSLLFVSFLMFATLAQAVVVCDLKENDAAVDELNEIFDQARMGGEDHAIGLKILYTARLDAISDCLNNDAVGGISKEELQDVVEHIQNNLIVYIEEINADILNSENHDRIGMATELTRERDLHIVDTKKLIAKIKKIISK